MRNANFYVALSADASASKEAVYLFEATMNVNMIASKSDERLPERRWGKFSKSAT